MRLKKLRRFGLSMAIVGGITGVAHATNGDNLIGIGPIARSMGGVGVAAPQDAISAVFANPAAMCFGPYCPGAQFDFAGTVFMPTVHATVQSSVLGIDARDKSQMDPFVIPAIGVSMPINPRLRFGLAAYGVSGMGVDYRNELDLFPGVNGSEGQLYTQYQVMKFAPNIAYLVNEHFSVGASIHVEYAALDFEQGGSHGYAAGIQLGTIYKIGPFSLGLSYISPQKVTHKRVYDFNSDGVQDDLDLEEPNTVMAGIAYQPMDKWLVEFDAKWLNWAGAAGYEDFDWNNQWVFGLGAQYKPTDKLSLRAGLNYGKNPVNEHKGFVCTDPVNIQGTPLIPPAPFSAFPTFAYEYLRIIGFPAIAETHVGIGAGYKLMDRLYANLGYAHAFATTVGETGTMVGPVDLSLQSELSEDSVEFGLSWIF